MDSVTKNNSVSPSTCWFSIITFFISGCMVFDITAQNAKPTSHEIKIDILTVGVAIHCRFY